MGERRLFEYLVVETERHGLRSEIVGWTHEDPRLVVPGHIGRSRSPMPSASPDCVLRALADGWRLLAPPERDEWTNEDGTHVAWTWWMEREVDRG